MAVRRTPRQGAIGEAPTPRQPRTPPRGHVITRVPKARGAAVVPPPHVPRAPRRPVVGAVPNPRKPKLVRDARGGALKDLFEIFPDLPRPRRPARRVRAR